MILGRGADFVSVLEAAYADEPDDAVWARGVVDAVTPLFPTALGLGLVIFAHDESCQKLATELLVNAPGGLPITPVELAGMPPHLLRPYFLPRALATTHTEIEVDVDPGDRARVEAYRKSIHCGDAVGVLARPEPGCLAVLTCMIPHAYRLTKHERQLLTRVGLHLESAVRLRRRPEALVGVLSPDGKVQHREMRAPAPTMLTEAVETVERARRRRTTPPEDGIALWRALVAGQVSLAEREQNGKRHYLVLENPPASSPLRHLSTTESGVLRLAARGVSGKLLGYAMGLSASSVSRALDSAAGKLGLSSRRTVIRLAAQLMEPDAKVIEVAELTAAERDILHLVRLGLSNADIAEKRKRSMRTVANQLASLLRKTESPSRHALITAVLRERAGAD